MIVINNHEDEQKCYSCYGNNTFVLTRDEVMSLLDGKTLGDPDFEEYGTYICMEKENKDD